MRSSNLTNRSVRRLGAIDYMLYRFKFPLLAQVKEKSLSGVFVGLILLAMTGWIYLLSTMFLKFTLWFFS